MEVEVVFDGTGLCGIGSRYSFLLSGVNQDHIRAGFSFVKYS